MRVQQQIDETHELVEHCASGGGSRASRSAVETHFRVGLHLARSLVLALSLLLMISTTVIVRAQKPASDLTDKTIEDLMDIEVTSVSKKEEKLSQTAAAVYVITQEEIRRSGMMSLPELLRTVPGLDVARIDGSKWAVSARGFNGRFGNKLLVLIDGRSVYSPETSGVYWEVQDLILEDIERIEIVRGPGGTLWGANAVNGVINIITKSVKDTLGGVVVAAVGSRDRGQASVRYGAKIGDNAYYRVYGKYFDRNGLVDAIGADANDGHNALHGRGRVDWQSSKRDSFVFSGDLSSSNIRETPTAVSPAAPFVPLQNRPGHFIVGNLTGRWTRTVSERANIELKVYYDRFSRDIFDLAQRVNTVDVDFQNNFAGNKHEVVWGLGYRLVSHETDSSSSTPVQYNPAKRTVQLFSAFAQDEFTLVPNRLRLTLGAKLEHDDFSGFEAQPNVRLLWTPRTHQTIWGSVARAVRAAAINDEGLRVNLAAFPGPGGTPVILALLGSADSQSEKVTAYELGYRAQTGKRFSLDIATFYNVYDRLQTREPRAPFLETDLLPAHLVVPLVFNNLMRGETYGGAASLKLNATRQWRLAGSYSFLQMNLHRYANSQDNTSEAAEGASPKHQFQFHSYLNLSRNFELDTALYHVSRLGSLGVPRYTRVDLRLGWRPSERIEFRFAIQNLLDGRHAEFGGLEGVITRQVQRSAYGKVVWKF